MKNTRQEPDLLKVARRPPSTPVTSPFSPPCIVYARVLCENAFAGMKRYGAVSAVYRNRKEFDEHLMLTAAGLWNFYLMAA